QAFPPRTPLPPSLRFLRRHLPAYQAPVSCMELRSGCRSTTRRHLPFISSRSIGASLIPVACQLLNRHSRKSRGSLCLVKLHSRSIAHGLFQPLPRSRYLIFILW